jgi:hypothetical protein
MSHLTRPDDQPGLSLEELDASHGEPLPDRTAMSTIHAEFGFPIDNFAMPVNLATATNTASPGSWAIADADQIVIVDQVDDHG